jgi:hypothetical protein
MSEQGNLIILSENLSTLCESVETCGIKDDTLAIFLITIDSSKLDQIKYYVDLFYGDIDHTWYKEEFYLNNFKGTCLPTEIFNQRKLKIDD